ncbi:acidic mammalian chitinase-like [Tropilaelaps mercedesae]|uniref:Acidic mammalian chitinase-like n=1 Tax=Tropilaelaps mercedesae TaxID=418985 RepID=A0A1V9XIY1_9ACAR|nr:acidic mammalian chitinase-like [Tropilaelaps mercedesae]
MAVENDRLDRFAKSALRVIELYEFDGLDLDWEFPAWGGMPWADRGNFVKLLKKLRYTFDNTSIFEMGKHILLTAAVAAPFTIFEVSYDIPMMAMYLDYCLLMGYDFNKYNSIFPFAEFNSPLFRHNGQVSVLKMLNLEHASNSWVSKGMPRDKLVVGIPFYGTTYKLANALMHDVGAAVKGPGIFNGSVSYPQVCNFIVNKGWKREFNNESRVPFAYHNEDWITYDDVQSTIEKVIWIMDNRFAEHSVENSLFLSDKTLS